MTSCGMSLAGKAQGFTDINRVVGLWTDRCKLHMAILLFCGVEAAETWDLHAQVR